MVVDRAGLTVLTMLAVVAGACDSGSDAAAVQSPIVCPPGQTSTCPAGAGAGAGGTAACSCQPTIALAGTGAVGVSGSSGQVGASGVGAVSGISGIGGFGTAGVSSGGAGARGGAGSAGTDGSAGRGSAGMGADGASGRGAAGGGAGMPAAGSGGTTSAVNEGPDGCSDTLVAGLSLSEIAVYQAIKVPVMKNMAAVEGAQRKPDLVQGRDALFRIHVTPQTGWPARQVSARVDVMGGGAGAARRFFAQLTPMRASVDDAPASAFRVRVPANAMTADARYAVTLVECTAGAAPGTPASARFPSDGFAALGARKTGPLRIHLIPINAGGRMPEITAEGIEVYRKRAMAMYPVTAVEFTMGEPLTSSATSMCSHLNAIRSRRTADRAPIDLYYYGLTTGTSGGQAGCSTATPTPNTTAKTSAGWWNPAGNQGMLEGGAATLTHEIGHGHGRLHSPCMVQDPDPNYPYRNADIGVWAYDMRTDVFLPPTRKDMMSYCPNPDRSGAWLSDYTYQALLERVAGVNALVSPQALVIASSSPAVPWRQLTVDSVGVQWGEYPLMVQDTPEGVAITAIVRDSNGRAQNIQVFREDLEDGVSRNAFTITLPEPQASWRTIEMPGLLGPQSFP